MAARERCPSAERAAAADWLRQQLRTYRDEANRLRTENQELRDQLARHLGAARATAAATGTQLSSLCRRTGLPAPEIAARRHCRA